MIASPRSLIVIGCVLCFISALGGALLALSIDEPEIVVTEQVVEVLPSPADLGPLPTDLAVLRANYVERSGVEDEWTDALVEEIAGGVCNGHDGLPELAQGYAQDPAIVLGAPELVEFMVEVEATCRSTRAHD